MRRRFKIRAILEIQILQSVNIYQSSNLPIFRCEDPIAAGLSCWRMSRGYSDGRRLALSLVGLAAVTFVYVRWLHVSNPTTVSMTFLVVVLVTAATSRLWVAIVTSLVAVLAFNFFFLPPIGTLTIADPHNWVALFAFLAVSLVASNLSAVARARTQEALGRRDELARLFDLSRDILVVTESREAITILARSLARRFDLDFAAIALPRAGEWEIFEAGESIALDTRQLAAAFATAQTSLEFDAYARTYAGHRELTIDGRTVRLVPLRVGTKPIGILAASGRPIEAGTLDTLGGVVAIAIERAQFLEERKGAELTRQSEAAENRAAGVPRSRLAHAVDRHPRRRQQSQDVGVVRRTIGWNRAT